MHILILIQIKKYLGLGGFNFFGKYYNSSYEQEELQREVESKYIHGEKINKEFSQDDLEEILKNNGYKNVEILKYIDTLDYIENPKKFLNKEVSTFLQFKKIFLTSKDATTMEDYIKFKIYEKERMGSVYEKLEQNPPEKLKKMHDISLAIKNVITGNLAINIKKDDIEKEFEYPKENFYFSPFGYYVWNIIPVRDKRRNTKII